MADTFSNNLKVRLLQTGAYSNTWGAVLNSDAINFLDKSIAGQAIIPLTTLTYSVAALGNGTDSEARAFCLKFIGAPSGAVTVTFPASVLKKAYLIDNQSGQDITFTYASSSNTTIVKTGVKKMIWCDGTDCWPFSADAADSAALGGVPAQYWARTGRTPAEVTAITYLSNVFVNKVRNSNPWATITEAPTTTIDCRDGNHQMLTLTGNRTLAAPTNPVDGQPILLAVKQDAAGSRTLAWNSIFEFDHGLTPTLASSASRTDLFLMIYDSTNTVWYVAHVGQDIGAGSGSSFNVTITENTLNFNLLARLGTLGGSITTNVVVAPGVIIYSLDSLIEAMDLSGLPSGSTVNLTLGANAYVLGRGGDGAYGPATFGFGGGVINVGTNPGMDGGAAIKGPGSGITFNVHNSTAFIWGGGGGGGAGGCSAFTGNQSAGGAGGAGAGGARGGRIWYSDAGTLQVGGNSAPGINSTAGAGTAGHGVDKGAGGAGGDWGTAGVNGTASAGGGTSTFAQTNGGAAGKAINTNGGSATLDTSGSPHVKGAVA